MTGREKLIELIVDVENQIFKAYPYTTDQFRIEQTADHLLANGVTFATDTNVGDKWIPVTEGLPDGKALTCDHRGNIHIMFHYSGFKDPFGISKDDDRYYPVTHWMPLPEPPKERDK